MASANKTVNTEVPAKEVFALHFLQSLSNLRTQNPLNSPDEATDCAKKIKMAAYVSMARAAGGTNRLWSRALLRRATKKNNKIIRFSRMKRKMTWQISSGRRGRSSSNRRAPVVEEGAERLRNFVPGGGRMETSKLMEETAHYIKCLGMQVKVMQCLVDGLSPK